MSTQINITVGSVDLSDKIKQLQQAARQRLLEKERQQRLETQATEQRDAKLKAEGKAPDGSLLYGARFNQPEIERRPAANRSPQSPLSLFYYNNTGEQYLSGDGLRSVTMNSFTPPPIDYAPLEPVSPLTVFSNPGLQQEFMQAQWVDSERTYLDPDFFTYDLFIDLKQQTKRRYIYGSAGGATWTFPLGNGSAIVVRYSYRTEASIITDYFVHSYYLETVRFSGAGDGTLLANFTDTIISESFSAVPEVNSFEEQWDAVIVGDTVATSAGVSTALKSKLLTITNESTSEVFTQAPRGCRFEPFADVAQCIGHQVDNFIAEIALNLITPVVNATPRFSYGIVGAPGCSPAAWVALESTETASAMEQASTHEEFIAIPAISSLFRSNYYIAPAQEKPLSWGGPSLTGDIGEYPGFTDSRWRTGVKLQSPLAAIPSGFNPRFINDWGRKAYCRSQASIL